VLFGLNWRTNCLCLGVLALRTVAQSFSRFWSSSAIVSALFISGLMVTAPQLSAQSFAQGPVEVEDPIKSDSLPMAPMASVALPAPVVEHKFWDRENEALFISVAAFSAADFAVTRSNLQNGGQELNPVTRMFGRSSAGLALNFAGETAGSIGISYFFHRTGHHKLERVTSMVNIGGSAAAVIYGLKHR
jgi:hypothetical protein